MAHRPLLGQSNAPCRTLTERWGRPIGSAVRDIAPVPVPSPPVAQDAVGTVPALTDRDVELLRHLAAGRSTAQVAAAMAITSNTVRTRVRRLEGRLAVTGRADAVLAAREIGVV